MKRLNDSFPDNVRYLVSPLRKKPAAEELMMSSGMFEPEFSETLPTQRVIFLPTIATPATANIAAPISENAPRPGVTSGHTAGIQSRVFYGHFKLKRNLNRALHTRFGTSQYFPFITD